jgi:hypothetical protein
LVGEVERRLDSRAVAEPGVYEPVAVSVAALVVSVASLAWTIYSDVKQRDGRVDREVLSRRIRVALEPSGNVDESERGRIINVVVEETLKQPA